MKTVEYYFTLVSPWTYLGDSLFRDIIQKSGAAIRHVPVNMGRVFDATGGLPLAKRSDARKALRMQELRRWREVRGIDLNLEPKHFPVSDKLAAGTVIAAQKAGSDVGALCHAYMRAVWTEERDISAPDTIADILTENGFAADPLLAAAQSPDTAAQWEKNTDEAISKGVMGAPFYIIGDEKLWGQDRLDFVERLVR